MAKYEFITGRNPALEVLRAGRRRSGELWVAVGVEIDGRLGELLDLAQAQGLAVREVPRSRLDQLHDHHQGVALLTAPFAYSDLADVLELAEKRAEAPLLLLLDMLQDPQNFGTLLRTAEAVGVHGVIIPYRRAVAVTPAVVSASSGASEHLLIVRGNMAQTIEALKQADVWVVGLERGPEAIPLDRADLQRPIALVVGHEGSGLRRLVRESCDFLVTIPMRGRVESLNAAVAGSIALYAAWADRGYAGSNA